MKGGGGGKRKGASKNQPGGRKRKGGGSANPGNMSASLPFTHLFWAEEEEEIGGEKLPVAISLARSVSEAAA